MAKLKPSVPDLGSLREYCGMFKPFDFPAIEWQQVPHSRKRKSYSATRPKGRWIYTPPRLQPEDERQPIADIAGALDKRPILALRDQVTDALSQMLRRAHYGDNEALAEFVLTVCRSVLSLQELTKSQFTRIHAEAEKLPRWPMLISLNPQEIDQAKQLLKSLAVGTKAPIPTKSGQRVDRRNLWTGLAEKAYHACRDAKLFVPILRSHAAGTKRTRHTLKLWRTQTSASFYTRADGDLIIIADWQDQATRLPDTITETNFKQWWTVMKLCILEFWASPDGRDSYLASIATINYGDTAKTPKGTKAQRGENVEARKRAHALYQIERAFRSLLAVPQKSPPAT